MRLPSAKKLHLVLSTRRIEALSDGVFAIVMTLLILSFNIIDPTSAELQQPLAERITSQWPAFLHFVESFVILAYFWVKHHQQFHFINKSDQRILWLNLAGLMFICMIPFSTTVMTDYGNDKIAALFFEGNMLAVGLIYHYEWIYATNKRRLVDKELDKSIIEFYKKINLLVPIISVVAIIVSIFYARLGTGLYFLLPAIPIFAFRRR
ncbi:MAG: DUF1211 domain-containing protein [Deltaproteobacteria bacterium]|jgi:uncharacterized membrane protein|nr:DUF1211 domain-containing protein [Deltaproteobacteria bacterium]